MNQTADPFILLEQAALRARQEAQAAEAVSDTRTKIVLGRDARTAFFAVLAMRLRMRPDWDVDTAIVDGRTMGYNPEYFLRLTPAERLGVVIHEVMHCAMGHFRRQEGREQRRWNIAADLAINENLVAAGLQLPAGACVPGVGLFGNMPLGESAERYYDLLAKPDEGGQGPGGSGSGDDSPDPGGCGGVRPPRDPAAAAASEAEWTVAVSQAATVARGRGDLPADIKRLVQEVVHRPCDWRALLRRFVSNNARNDYSWSRPNRRFLHAGLILPGVQSEQLGRVVVTVDTSGSIGPETLSKFADEISAILGSYDCELRVLYHDYNVTAEQEWRSTDGPLELTPVGGGGTSHCPVFERIEEDPPSCVICLTDGYTMYPPQPDVPVLWAMTTDQVGPFGETVKID